MLAIFREYISALKLLANFYRSGSTEWVSIVNVNIIVLVKVSNDHNKVINLFNGYIIGLTHKISYIR